MGLANILGPIASAAGTAVLQRTYLMQTQTASGIPKILAVLDAVMEEEPNFVAEVTQHPVESGPEVSDHVQLKNPTLRLKGTISNNPIDLQTSIGNLLSGGIDSITSSQFRANILNTGLQQGAGIAGAALLSGSANPLTEGLAGAADAIARSILLDVYEQRTPFDVITKRQRYESMVVERLSFPRDASTGRQLVFEIEMIRLRIVSPLTITLDSVSEDVVTSATDKANLGAQTTKQVSDQTTASVNKSWLRQIVQGTGG